MKDTDGRTNPIVLFSYHSSFKTVPRRGDRDARSHSKSIRSLFCDLGFQEWSDVVRIWYEFGTNWRYVEEKKLQYMTIRDNLLDNVPRRTQWRTHPDRNFIRPKISSDRIEMNLHKSISSIPRFKIFDKNFEQNRPRNLAF